MAAPQTMIFALDDTDHSFYALEWTLDHFFAATSDPLFKLVIVHVKTSPTSVVGLAGPGTSEVLVLVEKDIKKTAQRVCEKAKILCDAKGVSDVTIDVIEGDARNVLCDAVDKHHAAILVMGSHGYGAFKRAVLGSVSDYCSHHARTSVMIVKKPKTKH